MQTAMDEAAVPERRRRRRLWPWLLALSVVLACTTAYVTVSWVNREVSHFPDIDEDDPVAVAVHDAHVSLNSAVGWDTWRPQHISSAADDLRELAAAYPPSHPVHGRLQEAAGAIDQAIAEDAPAPARQAHAIVAGLERDFAAAFSRTQSCPDEPTRVC